MRGLEERVQELDRKLASALSQVQELENRLASSSEIPHVTTTYDDTQYMAPDPEITVADQGPMESLGFPDLDMDSNLPESWAFPGPPLSFSFVDELKQLSLEATAERHLGSSSGLSFAKLTQSVLRRLSPDKADFVFEINPRRDLPLQHESNLTSEPVLNSTMLRLEGPVSCFPILFGPFSMSKMSEPDDVLNHLSFPNESDMSRLVEFYFAHSHTLYPIIHRSEFISILKRIITDPQDALAQSPLWLFKIWMVLAVGSTTYSSVTLHEESESMLYYNKAMSYFEPALEFGDMVCFAFTEETRVLIKLNRQHWKLLCYRSPTHFSIN